MSEQERRPIVLRVFKGSELQAVRQFMDEQIVIGRSNEAQLRLVDDSVSLIHAAIELRDTGYFICDLGSEKGTKLNAQVILDTPIKSGDRIEIGDFSFEFFVGVPKPKSAPVVETPRVSEVVSAPANHSQVVVPVESAPVVAPAPIQMASVITEIAPPVVEPKIEEPVESTLQRLEKIEKPPVTDVELPVFKPSPQVQGGLETHTEYKPEKYKKEKHQKFAPKSKFTKVEEFIKPTRGTVLEVLVAWKERVINTYHFSQLGVIHFGTHPDAEIQVPQNISKQRKIPLIRIDNRITIMIAPEMSGELVRQSLPSLNFSELLKANRMLRIGGLYTIQIEQGEMLRLDIGDLTIYLRYVSASPKALVAPLFDLTAAESVGVICSVLLIVVLYLYNYLYTPPLPLLNEGAQEDPLRQAVIIVKPPPPPKALTLPEPSATPAPTPTPPPVKSTPAPKPMEMKAKQTKKETAADMSVKKDPGKAAEAAPNKEKTPTKVVGIKKGGSIKTTDSAAAQMQSKPTRDLTKSGMFSAFGGGGRNNELAKETAGAGELAGLSNQSTGKSGLNENRPGEGLGTIHDTGKGGNGTAAVGRPDVKGGNGRGTGNSGYGSGGIGGGRIGTRVQPGGNEESFSGSIDRDAIRRVIMANIKAIRACYEKQLNRKPDLYGKILIEWQIGERGRAISARVASNEVGDAEVGNCIVNLFKSWTFPEPPDNNEVTVKYPFLFNNS